jgi:two-component system sensor histidine kinase YesM
MEKEQESMKRLKLNVFKRLFIIYSIVIITTLSCLAGIITINIKSTIRNNQIYLNNRMTEGVSDYITEQNENFKIVVGYLYNNSSQLWDIINFLNYDYSKYIINRLGIYARSPMVTYDSINTFAESCFESSKTLDKVTFYSIGKDEFSIFDKRGALKYIKNVNEIAAQLKIDKDTRGKSISGGTMEFYKNVIRTFDLQGRTGSNPGRYYYRISAVKNPYKLNTFGYLILKYRLDDIDQIIEKFDYDKNNIMALDEYGYSIYDYSRQSDNEYYPFNDNLEQTDKTLMLDRASYVHVINNTNGTRTVGILPKDNVYKGSRAIINFSYLIAFVLILIAEMVAYSKIHGYSTRTEGIVEAMDKLQDGDFTHKINIGNDSDELSLIGKSFNDMSSKLEEYIDKVYKAEISEKIAEINALQSQINPHFLYNTLESIRMKAISNGDREVGKMLYLLSVLFRNMVKGASRVTLAQEMEYCRMYLELFKFRFAGVFDYRINVEEKLMNYEIIKFLIQPIIENYIIHGMNIDSNDNLLTISVDRVGDDLKIEIQDNGNGIEDAELQRINSNLRDGISNDSIGLVNVHNRIRLAYGENYGINIYSINDEKIESVKNCIGLCISILIPVREVA